MTEYKPRTRIGRVNIPFGWYVSPIDPGVLIPDPQKIEALHYAFRMKAKYGTVVRDCTQWLHAATGQRMTPTGFLYAYKNWLKKLRKERSVELKLKKASITRAQQKFVDENFKQFGIVINDTADIAAVAQLQAQQAWKKKENLLG